MILYFNLNEWEYSCNLIDNNEKILFQISYTHPNFGIAKSEPRSCLAHADKEAIDKAKKLMNISEE